MLHACVQRFDMTGTVEKILGTKQDLQCCEKIMMGKNTGLKPICHWEQRNIADPQLPRIKKNHATSCARLALHAYNTNG